MCSVTFYTNNDYKGNSQRFVGPQGKSHNLTNGINSLKIDGNTWLIVYNDKDYKGDYLKLNPGSQKDDLNHVKRGSSGDWKNQIESFVMYATKPSFWDTGSSTPTIPLEGCEVFIAEDTDFKGDNLLYTTPGNVPDVMIIDASIMMPGVINALKTGNQAWMTIFSGPNYTGDSLKIYPNTTYNDLNKVVRGNSGDWKNQIKSFQITDHVPSDWSLSFNLDTFHSLFPDHFNDSTTDLSASYGGPAIGYYTQDARYRIYDPKISYPTTDTMQVNLVIDHVIGMSSDDHVTLNIILDSDGNLKSVGYSWDAGGAYQIPDNVVEAVDSTIEMAGELEILDTLGISEVEAEGFTEVFDTACTVFNDISKLMNNWIENDGGRFYLIAVVSHIITRVCASVIKS